MSMGRIIVGVILVLVGVSALTGFSFFNVAFAIILILIGIRILSGRRHWPLEQQGTAASQEDSINEVAIFSPINKTVKSENFRGGKVVMVFGGGQIDISQVKTSQSEVKMEIVAVFGGGKLIIPKGWRVNSQGAAVFGGFTSHVSGAGEGSTATPTLNVKGAAVFGGVEVIN